MALIDLEKANKQLSGIIDDDLGEDDFDLDDDEDNKYQLSEDAKIKIYADKETVSGATTQSNDVHNGAIDMIEDAMKESLDAEINSVIENVKTEEARRNRSRLAEITKFIKVQRADIEHVYIH